jgi:cytochrome c551/c552
VQHQVEVEMVKPDIPVLREKNVAAVFEEDQMAFVAGFRKGVREVDGYAFHPSHLQASDDDRYSHARPLGNAE